MDFSSFVHFVDRVMCSDKTEVMNSMGRGDSDVGSRFIGCLPSKASATLPTPVFKRNKPTQRIYRTIQKLQTLLIVRYFNAIDIKICQKTSTLSVQTLLRITHSLPLLIT